MDSSDRCTRTLVSIRHKLHAERISVASEHEYEPGRTTEEDEEQ